MNRNYSIWLIPQGEVHDNLLGIISAISKDFNSPIFPPHVTLIGKIEGDEDPNNFKSKSTIQDHKTV